jgi:hypothetical protein
VYRFTMFRSAWHVTQHPPDAGIARYPPLA